ncbi:MAG: GtrA family protein [Prevotella sp.]|nr:GtrA family protein [Candidatus Prevotella equi]
MKRLFGIFKIRQEERKVAFLAFCLFTVLNLLHIMVYVERFSAVDSDTWKKFVRAFKLSGFDPITYSVLTDWSCSYNVFRHPLLAYFVWPFSKLNALFIEYFNVNLAIFIESAILIFFATYSFLFLHRIFHQIIGTSRKEANVLTMLTFSFAYIMLATIAPDHFGPSMFAIILALYICGLKLQKGRALNWWQTIVMFFFTAGISLNNGLKIFLVALMTRRRRFFKPGYIIIAVLLPSALMWGMARFSYATFVHPKELARIEKKRNAEERIRNRITEKVKDTIAIKDSALIVQAVDSEMSRMQAKREKRRRMSAFYKHTGEPIAKGEFSRWTDISTSRWDVAVENLFGESIMMHEKYLLGDVLVNRPVIVRYNNWFNYIIEALLLSLFAAGVWMGRRNHFLWTAMSCFLLDMLLHMGLGFGINEIFIMSAHYLFVLPIAMAYLLVNLQEKRRKILLGTLGVLAAYFWIWNISLLFQHLYM